MVQTIALPDPCVKRSLRTILASAMRIGAVCIGTAALTVALATTASAQSVPAQVTYFGEIAPLIAEHCLPCHRPGGDGPFSLASLADVRRRGSMIAAVTRSRFMPPWKPEPGFGDFHRARRLSDRQIAAIEAWVATGMAPGMQTDARERDAAMEPAALPSEWGGRAIRCRGPSANLFPESGRR